MGLPLHLKPNEDPEHHRKLVSHLIVREGRFGLVVIASLMTIAVIFALVMFPSITLLAAFVIFATMALFTLPMWLSVFEEDIEEETQRFDAKEE